MIKSILGAVTLSLTLSSQAVTISIIDSGVDYKHKALSGKIWTNPLDKLGNYQDEDRNGYLNDFYGWNFAERNNLVIDYKHLNTYSKDVFEFFAIQERKILGTITNEDIEWLKVKREDAEFMKKLSIFANFVHGTHVAGIAASKVQKPKVQAIKLLAQRASTLIKKALRTTSRDINLRSMALRDGEPGEGKPIFGTKRWKVVQKIMRSLVGEMSLTYDELGDYLHGHKIEIANGSFGVPFTNMMKVVESALKMALFKPTRDDVVRATAYMINELVKVGRSLADNSPNTLFVFAAGNEGLDNDKYPTFPTNIVADNVISVAATFEYAKLADFSNYGAKMVDVAAPGVLINSAIPGGKYVKVSGTSQASPFVAGVAAAIKEINPALTPKQIKQIIMTTVDVKPFLKGKVVSGGIVNKDRAILAAKATRSRSFTSMRQVVGYSRAQVQDVKKNAVIKRSLMKVRISPIQLTPVIY